MTRRADSPVAASGDDGGGSGAAAADWRLSVTAERRSAPISAPQPLPPWSFDHAPDTRQWRRSERSHLVQGCVPPLTTRAAGCRQYGYCGKR